ncbi:predicted protein [Naegleria gruberi]|uniref:Predicted protein n=1 Tax=Naegleria gruberi TaxID=5762 RepID=D2VR91_NAEGR|nr:uncharacterized protein NAEGRDRAFT_51623 [Naegleria gruberi]EFC40631.1 predicted protein [Naegleria gruberi]|eukprot:XP_002673375.1 predicted protein [Naegleria gruberi strain NEG-M]
MPLFRFFSKVRANDAIDDISPLEEMNMSSRIVSIKDVYNENDETFQPTQTIIWKPLVLFYFSNYSKTLNVKNWMHILRRRIIHLQIHSPNSLPLSKSKTLYSPIDYKREFIENCEWEYECPLKIDSMSDSLNGYRYCNVCKENVYEVHEEYQLKKHVEMGHCVILMEDRSRIRTGRRIQK